MGAPPVQVNEKIQEVYTEKMTFRLDGLFVYLFIYHNILFKKFKYRSGHSWPKNIQIINQNETDVNDWSSHITASDAPLACDLADVKPHLHSVATKPFSRASSSVSCLKLPV